MNTTSLSLLDRLKRSRPDDAEWRRMRDLYLPLIRHWLSNLPSIGGEADDVAQEVFVALVRELPSFERQRTGSFRAWLRQVTVNRVRAHLKARRKRPVGRLDDEAEALLVSLQDPHSEISRRWDLEHDRHVFQKLLAVVRPDFRASTWAAFTRFAIDDQSAATVARELGMTENAVVQAKYRVLKRLREQAGGLLD